MGDRLTILRSLGPRLTKLWKADGTIEPYDRARNFHVEEASVDSIRDLGGVLSVLENEPDACIIRGTPRPGSPRPIRRLLEHFDDKPLHTILIEVDNYRPLINDPLDGENAALEYIAECLPEPFQDASFWWQLSASAGAPGKEGLLKLHLWMWLDTPYNSAMLRAWAAAERLELDRAVLQPTQIHYTAAPVIKDGVDCPVRQRSGLHLGVRDIVPLVIDVEALTIRSQGVRQRGERRDVDDALADYVEAEWETWGELANGGIKVTCPWDANHSGGSKGDTSSVYFPAGTNGYREGSFICKHEGCCHRTRSEFASAIGYHKTLFEDLASSPPLNPAAPMTNSRAMMTQVYTQQGDRTLLRHRGDWFQHCDTHYVVRSDEQVRADTWAFLDGSTRAVKNEIVPFQPSPSHVTGVLDALRSTAAVEAGEPPCWLPGQDGAEPGEVLALKDGLLDLGTRALRAHTPGFFTVNALPYAWGGGGGAPTAWLKFLDEAFDGDDEQIECLQEIAGYLLTPDTSQQKIFLLLGPKRSGKGTIGRVLTALLGKENIAAPTLTSLTSNFGLQPLLGKLAAVVSDVRISRQMNVQAAIERLLMISGEDTVTVDRKNQTAWTGRLPARFLMMSNELPSLPDSSGALTGRFIVLETKRSFYGEEDPGLGGRLISEAPHVLRWALDGRDRLRGRGRFMQPPGARGQLYDLTALNSPIETFVGECCVLQRDAKDSVANLHAAWLTWCNHRGRSGSGLDHFSHSLTAAYPQLQRHRPRNTDGTQRSAFKGISLRSEARRFWAVDDLV